MSVRMDRQEAIDTIKVIKAILKIYPKRKKQKESVAQLDEALDMAIEALSADTVQGCDGCKYNTRIPQEECLMCKRYWRDGYERIGGDTE